MSKRHVVILSGIVAASLILSACGSGSGTSGGGGGQAAPVVGILLSQSGDLADLGKPMVKGGELGFKLINDAGGIWDGQKLTVKVHDDGTTEEQGRAEADKLVNVEKASAFVGATGSGVSKAVLNSVAKPANVAMCSPSSTSPEFSSMDDGGLFTRSAPSDALQGQVMAQVAYDKGYRKAAVIGLNNAYGAGIANVFKEAFTKLGGSMALDPVLYDPKGSTFTSEVQTIANAKPDVVVLAGYPDTGAIILKEAYEAGLFTNTHWILSEGMRDNDLASKVGPDANGKFIIAGVIGTSPLATGPSFDAFKAAYEKEYGQDESGTPYTANTYDCAVLIALALQKVGPDKAHDGKAIAQAIIDVASPPGDQVTDIKQALDLLKQGKDIDFQGASGTLDMDQNGDIAAAQYEVWTVGDDGKVSQVSVVDVKEGQ
ncbi:MAG: ABC transporter substrate-binding protein [Clostridia bacterium]|nr:ABC transporter substrate-binding protein [Clostridia bacterium]